MADHEQKDEGQGAEIVHLSDLPTVTLTIRVTDDEDALAAFEEAMDDPRSSYDGPMVMSHDAYERLVGNAREAGQGMEAYLKSQMRKRGILPR